MKKTHEKLSEEDQRKGFSIFNGSVKIKLAGHENEGKKSEERYGKFIFGEPLILIKDGKVSDDDAEMLSRILERFLGRGIVIGKPVSNTK
ncbi:MAG: hypothetical protein ABIH55_01535 [Nanoarchaeota archaeon]|nr:hypothetical protein [Nanoarchaeota archaeon]MBU1135491.1 hypothetical protein [Nanoarchaeota archaeon]